MSKRLYAQNIHGTSLCDIAGYSLQWVHPRLPLVCTGLGTPSNLWLGNHGCSTNREPIYNAAIHPRFSFRNQHHICQVAGTTNFAVLRAARTKESIVNGCQACLKNLEMLLDIDRMKQVNSTIVLLENLTENLPSRRVIFESFAHEIWALLDVCQDSFCVRVLLLDHDHVFHSEKEPQSIKYGLAHQKTGCL
jgi:hypothetical protein